MDLNINLYERHKHLHKYFYENVDIKTYNNNVMNFVLDIEACPNEDKTEAITYSTALMSCDDDSDICYFYNDVDYCLSMLLSLKCKQVNIYVHNLFYDIKPYLIKFIENYGNNPVKEEIHEVKVFNYFKKRKEKLKVLTSKSKVVAHNYQYSMCLKKGQLYSATLFGEDVKTKKGNIIPVKLNFKDTYKIIPYSLQKSCSAFLGLELPKDGLDYDKVRNPKDKLNKEEKIYIYNDVYGLSYLVKKLIINGFEIDGKRVKYTKITNSSQSLYDYKKTLLEDFENKQNAFSNENFYQIIDSNLMKSSFYRLTNKQYDLKLDILFKAVFPPQNYFLDGWIRHSYYGGLSTVDFKNVEKYSKYKEKIGVVLDVNSLYPYVMKDKLLPFGRPSFDYKPYHKMNSTYRKNNPLFIQEITIYDMKVKKGKMAFVQVKDRKDFNGREILERNINLEGKKVPITLYLCNPLLDLLFENYNVNSYKFGSHMGFMGANDLFKNYLDYWGEIKKKSVGANREVAKLRQNALYGKFGASGDNEITNIVIEDSTFKVNHTHEEYVTDNIYVAMSSFITSYAKEYLVKSINNNRDRFMYCDTDSLHLFGGIEEVKGLFIDSKIYGAWKHELTFDNFKYIGAKRYAERNIENGKWDIKCCGLSDSIMKQVDDINIFEECEYTSKELKKMRLYTNDSIYYYKDKECTKKIKGLIKSKKAKIVKNGTLIIEQPYMISTNSFYL